jgi:methanogenic corrinoid protein MtbC1
VPVAPTETAQLRSVLTKYLDALMARDSHRARAVVDQVLDAGADPGAVALEVLGPALHELGRRWELGELSVAHEHYATGITEGVMAVVAARMRRPPAGGRLAVVACPSGERHAVPSRIVGDFLEAAGWEVLVVGADTPARDLLELIADEQPDVVCLSTTMPQHMETTYEFLGALGTLDPPPLLAVGGQAWDGNGAMAEALGADLVIDDPRELVAVLADKLPPLPED